VKTKIKEMPKHLAPFGALAKKSSQAGNRGAANAAERAREAGEDIKFLLMRLETEDCEPPHVEALRALLAQGADLCADLSFQDSLEGHTALHIAAMGTSIEIVRLLLPHSDLNAINHSGDTPLMNALVRATCATSEKKREEHLRVADFLVSQGCDATMADRQGFTPLMVAATLPNAVFFAKILKRSEPKAIYLGSSAEDIFRGKTALMFAAQFGRAEAVKMLLPLSDALAVTKSEKSALHFAAQIEDCGSEPEKRERLAIFRTLLPAFKGYEQACDDNGRDALWHAVAAEFMEGARLLAPLSPISLKSDADPSEHSLNPLLMAMRKEQWELVDMLSEWAPKPLAERVFGEAGPKKMPRFAAALAAKEIRAAVDNAEKRTSQKDGDALPDAALDEHAEKKSRALRL